MRKSNAIANLSGANQAQSSVGFLGLLTGLVSAILMSAICSHAVEVTIENPVEFLEMEHNLSMEFETPHTKWAKPYAGGSIRAFFFVPWFQGSTDGREIIELMQRFDIEADAAFFVNGHILGDLNPRWYGDPELGTKRILQHFEKPYDVFFLNQITLDKLPETVQEKIRKAVQNGAGLVIIGKEITVPYNSVKSIKADAPIQGQCYEFGQGRIVLLPLREKLEYALGWETQFDHQMAEQGRAVLWAAQKSPRIALSVEVAAPEISRNLLPRECIKVTWKRPAPNCEARVQVRRSDGYARLIGAADMACETEASFALPQMRVGGYTVEVFAKGSNGMENWALAPFSIVCNPTIQAIQLSQDWGEIGETIRGSVVLTGSLESNAIIRIRLLDKDGRILARRDLASSNKNEIPFAFALESWMPMLIRAEALVVQDGLEVEAVSELFHVTKRHRDQFNFMVWNIPSGDLAPYGAESMAHYGTTMILQGGTPPAYVAANEMAWVPYAESFRVSSHTVTAMLDPVTGIIKSGCFWDEELMAERVKERVANQQKAREHGVFVYSLGDENAVRASCLSDHCLKAYCRYLADLYGDIGALNKEWETNFTSFDEITLLQDEALPSEDAPDWFKDYYTDRTQKNRTDNEGSDEQQIAFGDINDEIRALQQNNFARWYDRQTFQNYTYVNWVKRYVNAFRELDPQSLTGFEGTDSFSIRRFTTRSRQGGDLDAFVRDTEYFGPYEGPANEVVRSIAPPKFPTGNWIGYHMDADVLLEGYWDQVTNCMNTVQWWRWDNLDGYHGFISPVLAPFDDSREMIEDTQVVRDGLGTLLMQCQMVDNDIAMLYSLPSTYIAHFDGNRTYGDYKRDHNIWHEMIHDSGLQFRYVTDRMLRLGEFEASRYKIFILPLSFAIGPKEAEVIREFVRKGGTIIADVRPGVYDDHCKPLERGILDDVFGITRTGKRDAVALDRISIDGEIDGQKVSMRWGNWYGVEIFPQMMVDPTVTAPEGKNLGEAFPIHYWGGLKHPLCVVNKFGNGRAILLNFPVYNAPAQPLVKVILASAGVSPEFEVTGADGKEVQGVELTHWINGDSSLIALFGTYTGEVNIKLPQELYGYDLKSHKALGRVKQFKTSVRAHRAEVFALLPKEPQQPKLKLETETARLGDVVKATVSIPKAMGKHAVRLIVTNPNGRIVPQLERKLIVDSTLQSIEIPFAFNDPAGQWKVKAIDLFTNDGPSVEIKVLESEAITYSTPAR